MSEAQIILLVAIYLLIGFAVAVLIARAANRRLTVDELPFVMVWPSVVLALGLLVIGKLLFGGKRR